ncbi:IS66 family insertion sequence element accessory protein TnpA [Clostridium luticellarii]|uniref:Transposase n=1 Tax=Clostridium luticellarii TaxID=1691940 RepID=A0A2T0BLA6_9CLOT|nr:hypothetical protein [Clostridium luticellarii]PRR84665.1 hypothetical protein CLLU_23490 [Clostridium luticellarii]
MNKIANTNNLLKWETIIQDCRSSDMGVRAWCHENNIVERQFYYWERRIKGKNLKIQKETQNQVNFVEIQPPIDSSISQSTSTFRTDMVIHVGKNVLEISNTVSENLLSMVLKVISNVK